MVAAGLMRAAGYRLFALTIDYNQRHRIELEAASRVAQALNAERHIVLPVNLSAFGGSALTDAAIAVPKDGVDGSIPATYVPARNTIFLSLALGWAEAVGIQDLVIGINALDYSGYPDCRPDYIAAFQIMARLATRAGVEDGSHPLTIATPIIHMSKAQIVQAGIVLGVDYAQTVSCYQADSAGRACGKCDSCRLRKEGFSAANVTDPTRYQ